MEISKGHIRVQTKNNQPPTNVDIIGLSMDGNVIFKYKLDSIINYIHYAPDRRGQKYILFEVVNKSPLWNIAYNISPYDGWVGSNYYNISFVITIEQNLISEYINTSLGLNYMVMEMYGQSPDFNDTNLTNKSLIPYTEPVKPPKDFKIKLYEYQQKTLSKMLQIENQQMDFTINYTFNMNVKGVDILFDPLSNCSVNKNSVFKIKTSGGILSDEMGLGKTISSIALIASHPAPHNLPNTKKSNITGIDKINSRATIVLCPSHLTNQWKSEILRCNSNFKVLTILTKSDYNGLVFNDFINNDIIITSHQFIMNFKFYPTLHYMVCTASSYSFEHRNSSIKSYLNDTIAKIGFPAIKKLELPIFEFFNFHRLILDEGHEIFGEMLSTAALGRYMAQWVSNIDANYYWYVSGTPFINSIGVKNCARFIGLKLEDSERDLNFDYSSGTSNITGISGRSTHQSTMGFMNKQYIWDSILNKVCIRHRKVDVENQIQIPGYQEKLVWLKFTDLERQLYEAKKKKVSDQYLQQLCCHPLVVESSKKIFGDVEVDLSLMQDKLIEYHKNNYENYKYKLTKLDSTKTEYHMLKKSYETQMSESKYLFTILDQMKNPEVINETECAICMDHLENPTLTACGHLFCYDCLKMCLGDKKKCPMCKADLTGKDLLVMNLKKPVEEANPLIKKYGSKLGKLISLIRFLVAQNNTRIIIFSQWDDMLSLVGRTLAENGIENCFVKGNVWSRNSAIRKFKAGKTEDGNDNKVIMLSLKNAASGTNLTEATHIFFVEPINASKEEVRAIESQAIARACRVGQKQQIMLMRVLIEKTIEEDIYRQHYNQNVTVSFEEQCFLIEPTKPKVANPDHDGDAETESPEKPKQVKPKKVGRKKAKEIEV